MGVINRSKTGERAYAPLAVKTNIICNRKQLFSAIKTEQRFHYRLHDFMEQNNLEQSWAKLSTLL